MNNTVKVIVRSILINISMNSSYAQNADNWRNIL